MPRHGVPDVRENWQKGAGKDGAVEEQRLEEVFARVAAEMGVGIRIHSQPKAMFRNLYYNFQRRKDPAKFEKTDSPGAVWYNPQRHEFMMNSTKGERVVPQVTAKGIRPDLVIEHVPSRRRLVVEIKRQNAAGNAHQRLFRYLPLIPELRRLCGGVDRPFVACICGPMASDPAYEAEIQTGFDCAGLSDCVHFCRDARATEDWIREVVFRALMPSEP